MSPAVPRIRDRFRFPRIVAGLALLQIAVVVGVIALSGGAHAEPARRRSGDVRYEPPKSEDGVPEQFRLATHSFHFAEETRSQPSDKVYASRVTFPSPVTTEYESNNTVHCEYFRPTNVAANEKLPGVVVLHILGGDFPLSRLFCNALAQQRCAALFVKMPYYGPRRPQGVSRRMISADPSETVAGMRQAILDIRRARAWLEGQDEIDDAQLGVFGISLGGITAALAGTLEPRFTKVCPMLAGGDIAQVAWESPELARVRREWERKGQSRDEIQKLLLTIDPVTYAANLKGRSVLMLNASQDEVIPRPCTDSLWESFGRPRIVWYNAGHISALRYLPEGLNEVSHFFAPAKRK
ncbi:MAG: alpha/beta hydrolase family protein [Pirellulales bacterium]